MSEIKEWFLSMPPITRAWFGLSVAFPLIGRLGILNAYYMILTSDFITKLHLWRPLSATFYYPLTPGTGFHYLINLYFLYNYSKNLETNEFTGRPADYLFMLMFNWAALVLMGIFMNLYLLMDPLILSVLYVWCNLNPELIVSFWFGTRFKARYLPWVLCGFNLLLGSGGFNEILGIIVGHLYFYVKYKYPQDNGGAQLINTPNFLLHLQFEIAEIQALIRRLHRRVATTGAVDKFWVDVKRRFFKLKGHFKSLKASLSKYSRKLSHTFRRRLN